jgi:hypothetical protein
MLTSEMQDDSGHRHGAQGNLSHFGRQRQLLTSLRQRLDQGADAHAGLGPHRVFAEFQNAVEAAGVDRGSAVAAHAARLRIVGSDHAHGRWVTLGFFQQARNVFESLQAQHQPRTPIDAG